MKRKDMIYLLLAVVILLAAGYIAFTQLSPKKTTGTSNGVTVEKIGVIPAQLSTSGLAEINDVTKVQDFNSPQDFTGLGNNAPFGP